MAEQRSQMKFSRDYPVIDVDVHIHEDFAAVAKFADGTLRRSLEMERSPDARLDMPGYSPFTAYDPPIGEKGAARNSLDPEFPRAVC